MKWTLLVTGHGRWPYLSRALDGLHDAVGLGFFDRSILSLDGGSGPVPDGMRWPFGEVYRLPERRGLTANLAQGWSVLNPGEWVFHLEEDFVVSEAPLLEMADAMMLAPRVANMVLVRQPWGAHEIAAGSVLAAQPYELTDREGWLEHLGGFWLNPCVYRSDTALALTAGVESFLSEQCRAYGWSFGYWGSVDDDPRCWHIGTDGGMGTPGWLP